MEEDCAEKKHRACTTVYTCFARTSVAPPSGLTWKCEAPSAGFTGKHEGLFSGFEKRIALPCGWNGKCVAPSTVCAWEREAPSSGVSGNKNYCFFSVVFRSPRDMTEMIFQRNDSTVYFSK